MMSLDGCKATNWRKIKQIRTQMTPFQVLKNFPAQTKITETLFTIIRFTYLVNKEFPEVTHMTPSPDSF